MHSGYFPGAVINTSKFYHTLKRYACVLLYVNRARLASVSWDRFVQDDYWWLYCRTSRSLLPQVLPEPSGPLLSELLSASIAEANAALLMTDSPDTVSPTHCQFRGSIKCIAAEISGGSRNLERGVQPLVHETHPTNLGLPRPLPVR